MDLDVHGGITYSGHCQGDICHKPAPGESDEVWWIGFDCAHFFDVLPLMEAATKMLSQAEETPLFFSAVKMLFQAEETPLFFSAVKQSLSVYRDTAYVKKEVESLADQLAAMKKETL
jgi:hypothetical protein